MNNRIKLSIGLLGLVFFASACNRPEFSVGGHPVQIEVAKTTAEQNKGLGGRDSLAPESGMLFMFNPPAQPPFWMKDMQFDLDFIWIKDGRVIEITPNVKAQPGVADKDLPLYRPERVVDSMLEVNAGWAQLHQIKVGDRVDGI